MKKIIFVLLGITTVFIAKAQSNKEDIDIIQALYGKQKKAIVADFIVPPDAKKTAFWELYDAYETERKALGKKRIALLEKYAKAYDNLTDKTTDDITKQTIALQKSTDGLISTYYEKIKLAVGVKQAAQFYQLEGFLLSAVRMYILDNIPFIDQLEKTAAPAPAAGK